MCIQHLTCYTFCAYSIPNLAMSKYSCFSSGHNFFDKIIAIMKLFSSSMHLYT